MADEPIDLNKRREQLQNKKLPRMLFVELPECELHPNMFLVQLFHHDGTPLQGRVGLHFELDDAPAVALTAKQCRALSEQLSQVAEDLEGQARDGHG